MNQQRRRCSRQDRNSNQPRSSLLPSLRRFRRQQSVREEQKLSPILPRPMESRHLLRLRILFLLRLRMLLLLNLRERRQRRLQFQELLQQDPKSGKLPLSPTHDRYIFHYDSFVTFEFFNSPHHRLNCSSN